MIRAVIFDIDNTLYDYDAAHAVAYRALIGYAAERLGLPAEEFDRRYREANVLQQRHTGGKCAAVHNRLIRCQLVLEGLGAPLFHAPEMAELYWSVFLDAAAPYPDTISCFDSLSARGYTLGAGTNMTADYQFAKLRRLGLLDRLDFIVSSEETDAEKPDPRFFACCVEKARCAPEQCAFVGDDLRGDVDGAAKAGLKSVWLRRGAPSGAESIHSLAELPARLPSL